MQTTVKLVGHVITVPCCIAMLFGTILFINLGWNSTIGTVCNVGYNRIALGYGKVGYNCIGYERLGKIG